MLPPKKKEKKIIKNLDSLILDLFLGVPPFSLCMLPPESLLLVFLCPAQPHSSTWPVPVSRRDRPHHQYPRRSVHLQSSGCAQSGDSKQQWKAFIKCSKIQYLAPICFWNLASLHPNVKCVASSIETHGSIECAFMASLVTLSRICRPMSCIIHDFCSPPFLLICKFKTTICTIYASYARHAIALMSTKLLCRTLKLLLLSYERW